MQEWKVDIQRWDHPVAASCAEGCPAGDQKGGDSVSTGEFHAEVDAECCPQILDKQPGSVALYDCVSRSSLHDWLVTLY